MKNLWIATIFASLLLVAGTRADAEVLICGFSGANPKSNVMFFYLHEDRNTPTTKYYLGIERRSYNASGRISTITPEPALPASQIIRLSTGHRKVLLIGGGSLDFVPSGRVGHKLFGQVYLVRPLGPELAQVYEDCFLDPSEIGFTIKN